MPSSKDSSACSSFSPLPRDSMLMEGFGEFHGLVHGFAFDEIDHDGQAGLGDGASVAIPYEPSDGVWLGIGDFGMDGGLVTTGRAELVRFSRRAVFVAGLHRGFGGMRGVFRSEVRCEMPLPCGFFAASRMTSWYICSRSLPDISKSLIFRYSTPKNGRTFAERLDEGLRVFDRIVDAAGRAVGGIHAEVAVHRLRAVVSDADGDAPARR